MLSKSKVRELVREIRREAAAFANGYETVAADPDRLALYTSWLEERLNVIDGTSALLREALEEIRDESP